MSNSATPPPADLALLAQVIRGVTRNQRLSPADAEDFAQSVHLKLLEDNYGVFHQFTGRSSLRTYLVVVVTRLVHDWRCATYGRWRASAAAGREGPHAMLLERLVQRDGCTIEQAIEIIRGGEPGMTMEQLREIAARLPWHQRQRLLPADTLPEECAAVFDDPVEAEITRSAAHLRREALASALRGLSLQERRMIVLRYCHGHSVQALARRFKIEPKRLYRRFDRMLRALRTEMQTHGVSSAGRSGS
jgi:RNA polymerase sigma factor (sigma-70 family)